MIDGATKHTLYLSNDNDYTAVVANSHHPTGTVDNPNTVFVFAFADDDLPATSRKVDRAHDDDRDGFDDHDDDGRGW